MIPTLITITHLGAETCVTGSCHLVQVQPDYGSGINILVDCGIAHGHDKQVPFDRSWCCRQTSTLCFSEGV